MLLLASTPRGTSRGSCWGLSKGGCAREELLEEQHAFRGGWVECADVLRTRSEAAQRVNGTARLLRALLSLEFTIFLACNPIPFVTPRQAAH